MDEACSMHETENKCIHGLGQKTLRNHLQDLGTDGLILKCILK